MIIVHFLTEIWYLNKTFFVKISEILKEKVNCILSLCNIGKNSILIKFRFSSKKHIF